MLRQHSSSRAEQGSASALQPARSFVARTQSAPTALLVQANTGGAALSGAAAADAREDDVWGLEALAAPQASGARAAASAPPSHDPGHGLSATMRGGASLAALLQRAPSLSFMLSRSVVPKAL
jgi:hypothetical protein